MRRREALSLIHSLRSQGQSPIECLAAIAADQTLTELRRGGPTRPPIRPRMEVALIAPRVYDSRALRRLDLSQTAVTAEAVRALQDHIPLCRIIHPGGVIEPTPTP